MEEVAMKGDRQQPDTLLVCPAWHDPKVRTVVIDASTISLGVLAVDAENVAFASAQGIEFAGRLRDTVATWPWYSRAIRGCNLTVNGVTHRLYFARPNPDVPRASTSEFDAIIDHLNGPLTDVVGLVSDAAGLVGPLLALPGAFFDEKRGRSNGDAFRQRLEASHRKVSR